MADKQDDTTLTAGSNQVVTSEVILGDCLEVMRHLPDNHYDLILTDPPYGKKASKGTNGFGTSKNRTYEEDWDKLPPSKEYFDEIIRVSKNQIIFGGNYFTDKLPPSNCWLVWDKIGSHKFDNPFADCELAWTSFNRVVKKYTVIQQGFVKQDKDPTVHPTQKPSSLLRQIIRDFAKEGEIIFDPFAGSGSTLRAAKDLGFTAYGVEIQEKYISVIEQKTAQEVLL